MHFTLNPPPNIRGMLLRKFLVDLFRYFTPLKLRYFIYLLLFIAAQICVAQPQEKALLFERLTINDGLSQGMVNSIIQDDYGFMWFATNDGLNRFDGRNFTIFKNKVDDYSSIAENFIVKLFKDSKGRIWISTLANGLDLFDAETETFVHFKHNPQNNNSIHSNELTDILEDKYGAIKYVRCTDIENRK